MKTRFVMAWLLCAVLFSVSIGGAQAAKSPRDIYRTAGPGVVFILASEDSHMGSVGTGSIIRPDGLVITNAHIFIQPESKRLKSNIGIFLKPEHITGNHQKDLKMRYKGKILAYDIPLDLALVQIVNVDRPLTAIRFADSDEVVIGDQVYAIGHPEQGGLWSLTTGVISAYRQDYGGVAGKDLFQTDASINRGNSGGPLLDVYGGIIGINSLIARKAADGLTITDVNYSIRSNVALNWLNHVGYRFASRKPAVAGTPSEDESGSTPKAPEPPKAAQAQTPPSPREKRPAPKMEPVETRPQPTAETSPPAAQPTPKTPTVSETPPGPPPDGPTGPPAEPEGGKILTRKKPYRMSQLLRDMQEMEDMMDDMRRKIRRFQQNQ